MDKKRAIALGAFDGLHLGHLRVLEGTKQFGLAPSVLLFSEHPAKVLCGTTPPILITDTKRDALLREMGIEPLKTDFREIVSLSARDFVQEILRDRLHAGAVSCGENYTFGKERAGTPAVLKALCAECGIQLFVAPTAEALGAPVSSTRIRKYLQNGEIESANALLGRRFSYAFEVVHGDARGRTLHFPTINQFFPSDFVVPKYGVYASQVFINGSYHAAVTNIGVRPTIGTKTPRSETCILGFSGDLYGQYTEVELLSYLRPEQKFDSLDALRAAIQKDSIRAAEIFENPVLNVSHYHVDNNAENLLY